MSAGHEPLVVVLATMENRVWFGPWVSLGQVARRSGYDVVQVPPATGGVQLRRLARRIPGVVPAPQRRILAWSDVDHLPRRDEIVWVLGTDYNLTALVQCLTAMDWRSYRHTVLLGEVWRSGVPKIAQGLKRFLPAIATIAVSVRSAVDPLAAATGVDVRYLPLGFDPALAAAHEPQLRRIDVVNIGRRDAHQHVAVQRFVDAMSGHYHYDTLATDRCVALEEHLVALMARLGTTRVSITNPAKFDTLHERDPDEIEIPGRLVEAAGMGAVPVGLPTPDHGSDPYFADVPWVDLGPDPDAWTEQLIDLWRTPERLDALAVRCRSTMLANHTWAHRLAEVVGWLGRHPSPLLEMERAAWVASATDPWRRAASPDRSDAVAPTT